MDLLKSAKQEDLNLEHGDVPSCFIDVDFKLGRDRELRNAIKFAKENRTSLYLSNPCFEIWYLLHFNYSTKQYGSNEEVIRDLKSHIFDYSKSKDVFDRIQDDLQKAIMNGKKLDYYHLSNGTIDPLKKLPSTDVYKFVESFLEKRD